jgi:hypothetical protein
VTAVDSTARAAALTPPRGQARPPVHRAVLQALLWSGLVLAFVLTCVAQGMPTDRVVLLAWVLTGLSLHAALQGWGPVGRLFAHWVPWSPFSCSTTPRADWPTASG